MDSVSNAAPSSAPASAPTPSAPAPSPAAASATPTPVPGTPSGTPAPKVETAAEKRARILKLKEDGEEFEYDVSSKSDEELARDLQLSRVARKRLQETSAEKERITAVLELFKNDPWAAAEELGVDLDGLAEKRIAQKYREQTLPEHERAVLQAKREAEALAAKVAKYEQTEKQRVQAEAQKAMAAQVEKEFRTAITQHGLPDGDETLSLMATVAKRALAHGVELTPAQMAAEVKEYMTGIRRHSLTGLKGEALVKELGDDIVREVLTYLSASRKAAQKQVQPTAPKFQVSDDAPPKRKIVTSAEWKEFLRK